MKTQVLTKSGLILYDSEIKDYIQTQIEESKDSVLEFPSVLNFPATGKVNTIYLDKSKNDSYRWDSDAIKYYCVGASPESIFDSIKLIDGSF